MQLWMNQFALLYYYKRNRFVEMSSEASLTVTFEDDSYSQETLEYLGETIEVPRK